ncbi:hypothetical protein F511_39371 [Dorcoceras hygrometricum]|uniref:Uncharacterized protein n=1 Tax=Dorcoceras hygrometricum TaxID=472368 RepID=A0A2Z7A0L4_9LAMI|nr:hypothetical protein F511_39371 [Dorcoceras hygrometricum]
MLAKKSCQSCEQENSDAAKVIWTQTQLKDITRRELIQTKRKEQKKPDVVQRKYHTQHKGSFPFTNVRMLRSCRQCFASGFSNSASGNLDPDAAKKSCQSCEQENSDAAKVIWTQTQLKDITRRELIQTKRKEQKKPDVIYSKSEQQPSKIALNFLTPFVNTILQIRLHVSEAVHAGLHISEAVQLSKSDKLLLLAAKGKEENQQHRNLNFTSPPFNQLTGNFSKVKLLLAAVLIH